MTLAAYRQFIASKAQLSTASGFACDPSEVNPILKPFQAAAVAWAVRGGRRALFESFGLGKTIQQLEVCRLILEKSGGGRGLGVELSASYHADAVAYLRAAERDAQIPSLFDSLSVDDGDEVPGLSEEDLANGVVA